MGADAAAQAREDAAPLFDLLTLDPDGNETTPSNCDESRPCCETSEVSLAARPAAEPELAQTASTADREAAARGEETFEHTQYKSRREAFDLAFDRVDSDENGYVSVSEIRVLATLDSPAANAAESKSLLQRADLNADGRISRDEWASILGKLTGGLSAARFNLLMAPLVADGAAPLIAHANGERAYPSANREKIAATVGPLLERGLAALVERLLADHATVAAGAQWDADGHLPVRYRALQPLRLLGEWLRANNPYAPPEPNPIEFDWSAGIPWGQLTPGRIFHVVFAHLDKGGSGYLTLAEVLAYTDTFRYVGLESARAIAEQLECHCIDLEEFSQLMTAAFEGCGDAAFRQEMLPMLTAFMLSKMPRKAKFRHVFARLAEERKDGESSVIWSIVMTLARQLLPGRDADALDELLAEVPHADGALVDPFVLALELICQDASDCALADALGAIISGSVELDPSRELAPDFQAHVRRHCLYARTPAISPAAAMALFDDASVSEVIMVDCRTAEEYEVSTIIGSVTCDMLVNPTSDLGWEPDADALAEVTEHILESSQLASPECSPVVVTFCTDGSRGSQIALRLARAFPTLQVLNLCGGLIAWYNVGGAVTDFDGVEVERLHPSDEKLGEYITRSNAYETEQ